MITSETPLGTSFPEGVKRDFKLPPSLIKGVIRAMDWRDRHVLITGASSGIGETLAHELGRHGARISLLARRADRLDQVKARIEESGGEAATFPTDVKDRRAVEAAANGAVDVFGPLDVLIVNAGMSGRSRSVDRIDAEREATVITTNLLGAVYSVSAALPSMLARGSGRIAAISSIAGWKGLPGSRSYSAGKAGFSAYFEALRVELRSQGISVTVVHPGFVDTPFLSDQMKYPVVVPVEKAARWILRAVERRKPTLAFPLRLTLPMRLARVLPAGLYDRLAARGDRYIARSVSGI